MNLNIIGIAITLLCALIGYAIGMFKVPESNGLQITKKVGGENIDDAIKRYIKFKMNKKKIYVYTKEEKRDE